MSIALYLRADKEFRTRLSQVECGDRFRKLALGNKRLKNRGVVIVRDGRVTQNPVCRFLGRKNQQSQTLV